MSIPNDSTNIENKQEITLENIKDRNLLLEKDFLNLIKGGGIEIFSLENINQAREAIFKAAKANPENESVILRKAHEDFNSLSKKTILKPNGSQIDLWLRKGFLKDDEVSNEEDAGKLGDTTEKVDSEAIALLSKIAKYLAMNEDTLNQQKQIDITQDTGVADDQSKQLIAKLKQLNYILLDDEGNIIGITEEGKELLSKNDSNQESNSEDNFSNSSDSNDSDILGKESSENNTDNSPRDSNIFPNSDNEGNREDNREDKGNIEGIEDLNINPNEKNVDSNGNPIENEEQEESAMQEDDVNKKENDPGSQEMGDGSDDPENDGNRDDDANEDGNISHTSEEITAMASQASDDDLKAFIQDPSQPDNLKQVALQELENRTNNQTNGQGNEGENTEEGTENVEGGEIDPLKQKQEQEDEEEKIFEDWMDEHFDGWDREDLEDMVKEMILKSPIKRKEIKEAFRKQYPTNNEGNQFSGRINKEGVEDLEEFILKYLNNMTDADLKKYGIDLLAISPEHKGKMRKTYTSYKDNKMIKDKSEV